MSEWSEGIAWAAGLFEGEGCTYLDFAPNRRRTRSDGWKRRPRARMKISMTDHDILLKFQAAVGGLGYVNGPYDRGGPTRKPISEWAANRFEIVQAIAAMLWKWLGPRRREQIRLAFAGHSHQSQDRSLTHLNVLGSEAARAAREALSRG